MSEPSLVIAARSIADGDPYTDEQARAVAAWALELSEALIELAAQESNTQAALRFSQLAARRAPEGRNKG